MPSSSLVLPQRCFSPLVGARFSLLCLLPRSTRSLLLFKPTKAPISARFFVRMSSSASSWTSANNPMCTCGKPAKLRISNTPRNLGRSFCGCPNYNTKDYHTVAISNGQIAVRKEKKIL
ncbi:uncharacterized protein LOC121268018 [Juglans microcarpa x Juglans regia]|uniref:uncharacterized protein LOC121268018 n=1 Tax=Juglans microcarpa x Juglans regia TaxID=2249226 RepID=UPI001B7E8567|nr:uncharacterized protein LOC121268018 [Juglans microcarpa x Juglans regia]